MKTSKTLFRELMGHAASAGSLDAVYRAALQCVKDGLGIDRASLLLFDESGKMRFVAWSGLSDEYRRAVDGHSPWSPDESNAVPELVADVEDCAALAPLLAVLRGEHVRALAFIPLQFGAKLHGKFVLYYREPHVFTKDEVDTAEQIANCVVMSLEHHRLSVALREQLVTERDLRQCAEIEAAQRRESESRLHLALSAGQMGTWEWDLASNRVHWSEELERMHGLAPGSFGGNFDAVKNFVHPLDVGLFCGAVGGIPPVPETDYEMEYRITRADGECRWLAARGRALSDGDGKPVRMVGVTSDVTELKRMAEAANEADHRKDEFLATLAHELRNPLAALRTEVAVVRGSIGNGELDESCKVIERQLRHLTRLVDDLLDVADITRRGLPLEKIRIEVSTVVRMALEQGHELAREAGHELIVKMPAETFHLDGDPARLVQVLTNLLSNAVKYTPRGGRIELAVESAGDEVRLSVKDSGLGIPADKLESVFEMFSQLDRSLETGYKGLGIGLALARTLVTKHGGKISARSDGIGRGSEFIVWMPLSKQSEPAPLQPAQAFKVNGQENIRVLLVDDNRDVANAMSRLLRVLGHEVRVAFDGCEAMQVAEVFLPDVVMLDIAMPKVNGYEVARMLRSKPWGRELTLVAITGWGREQDQRRSAEAGFDRHMTKPVDPAALQSFLGSVARRQTAKVGHTEH